MKDIAKEMGKEAFKKGLPCVPVADKELYDLLCVMKNNLLPVIKAWQEGWTEANLREPLKTN